jgi:YggT family protein
MKDLFNLIAAAMTVYTLLCFVRILITWVPSWSYTRPGRFLASLCDPWLNLFRGIPFLRFGNLDFSPVIALAALSGISSLAAGVAVAKRLSVGIVLAQAVTVVSSVVSSILGLLILMLVLRVIAALVAPHSMFRLWAVLDQSFAPLLAWIRKTAAGPLSHRATLGLALLLLVAGNFVLGVAFKLVIWILTGLPF